MGLDVVLHEKVSILDGYTDGYNCFQATVIDDCFKKNISSLVQFAYYRSEKKSVFISYPYSYHASFRSKLCLLIGKHESYWREFYDEDDPFHELLYFADNDGCIDWKTSNELLRDFMLFKDKALTIKDDWFVEYYKKWLDLFKQSSKEFNVIEFR